MAVLVTAWGARLTFNFARKGGYTGMEDYRWAILRGRMKPWQFQLFNLFFIVLYQNALLVLITPPRVHRVAASARRSADGMPRSPCSSPPSSSASPSPTSSSGTFHRAKKAAGGTLEPGFVTTGLFAYSRHPNFFFEQAQWWAFYAIGATAAVAVGARPVGRRDQLDDPRRGAADAAVHRLDDLHRVDHGVEVPRVRRLPAHDVDARAAAPAPTARPAPERPDQAPAIALRVAGLPVPGVARTRRRS